MPFPLRGGEDSFLNTQTTHPIQEESQKLVIHKLFKKQMKSMKLSLKLNSIQPQQPIHQKTNTIELTPVSMPEPKEVKDVTF